jgi:pantoate--beta-alanine ligase
MQLAAEELRCSGKRIGFVPTMGYLHEGHLSLVRASRHECEVTAASIFLNPTQFGPAEDLERYPQDFERDKRMLEAEGVDLLFAPVRSNLYPEGFSTTVRVDRLSQRLCGASRPWHFPGVALVVAKLLNLVRPHVAFFGQKDYQQCLVVERMVQDLDFGVEIRRCPIVREPDGLAMSSRNVYLSPEEREEATVLIRSLAAVNQAFLHGERSGPCLEALLREVLGTAPGARVDYAEVVDARSLEPVSQIEGSATALVAVFFGKTRLIDNHVLGEPLEGNV